MWFDIEKVYIVETFAGNLSRGKIVLYTSAFGILDFECRMLHSLSRTSHYFATSVNQFLDFGCIVVSKVFDFDRFSPPF
ncbi:MAG: hypothetical protein UU67_C0087G0005 [Candidatus Daviesbacteria bacterium GW2011_GWB1_41_5]|uniref:Uncharacterized protein n=1 Tax=Candidatus Daviesbacteria bacterium GW2011_GWB1_41_5 TaxID=1618429 RepID=A0A0G0WG70_9BACT|nr:MAG: hypothetical protein UU67_C0087G0005 [Candidatus Daviesbacteria bacterium GW2011_GWB1_41_5]